MKLTFTKISIWVFAIKEVKKHTTLQIRVFLSAHKLA